MTMDDVALSRFALGVAPAAAAFLAIWVAILIFLFDRRKQDEVTAFKEVRNNTTNLYNFLVSEASSPGNYC